MIFKNFGFIGLGLIGGSIARAIRKTDTDAHILIFDPDSSSALLSLDEGIADVISTDINEKFSSCDMIFLCAPVLSNNENIDLLLPFLSDNCILTDVGSVKLPIHNHIRDLGLSSRFIGAHPMTGSERVGFENAKARLLQDAYYILAPEAEVSKAALSSYEKMVLSWGAIPLVLNPEEHDYITGAVSHLPHIIAASLVNFIQSQDNSQQSMRQIAAGGFKDITRIASSSPVMWQNICLTNRENVCSLLDSYIQELSHIKTMISDSSSEALLDFFTSARDYRDSFVDTSSGPIRPSYMLRVDIPDEAGAIANVAGILAANNINIKNIGISHNREHEEGILTIEFHEKSDVSQAIKVLNHNNYSIHLKN